MFSNPTHGMLDYGGASTQATFIPSAAVLENKYPLEVTFNGNHTDYGLYANSWMRSGQDQAHLRMLRAECGPTATTCKSKCHMKDFEIKNKDLSSYGSDISLCRHVHRHA